MNLLLGALAMGLMLSLLTLGVLVSWRVLHVLDLTADGAFGIGAAVTAALLVGGVAPLVATLAGVLAGAASGAATALLCARLRVAVPLAGLLVSTALYSVILYVLGGGDLSIAPHPTLFAALAGWSPLARAPAAVAYEGSALVALGAIVLAVALGLRAWFATDAGLALRAVGDNPAMARAQGIDVRRTFAFGLVIANGAVALSGALFAQYEGFASVQMGVAVYAIGLACVVLGGTLIRSHRAGAQLAGAIVGALLFRLIVALALRAGLAPSALKLVTAALAVLLLALPAVARRLAVRSMSWSAPAARAEAADD